MRDDSYIIDRANYLTNKYNYLISDKEDAFQQAVLEGILSYDKWMSTPNFNTDKLKAFVFLDMKRGLLQHIYKQKDDYIEDYPEMLDDDSFDEYFISEDFVQKFRTKLKGKKLIEIYDLLVSGMPRNEIIARTGVQKSHFYGFYLKKLKKLLLDELFSAYNI